MLLLLLLLLVGVRHPFFLTLSQTFTILYYYHYYTLPCYFVHIFENKSMCNACVAAQEGRMPYIKQYNKGVTSRRNNVAKV